jgi:hypothetical protein
MTSFKRLSSGVLTFRYAGYAKSFRNSYLLGSILFDARNLRALDAEARHQSLLVKNESVGILF